MLTAIRAELFSTCSKLLSTFRAKIHEISKKRRIKDVWLYSLYSHTGNWTTNFCHNRWPNYKIIKNIMLPKPAGTEGYAKGISVNPDTNGILYVCHM
jgi:hypothetical protein